MICRLLLVTSLAVGLSVNFPSAQAATLHVSLSGKSGASGTEASPFASLAAAVALAQPGDVIRVAGGTYPLDQSVLLEKNGTDAAPIRIEAREGTQPVLDFSAIPFESRQSGIAVKGDYWHLVGLEVTGAARSGINVTGHHNIIENCRVHDNQGTGIDLSAPASHNLVLNCDSYRNVDRPTRGENADGFGAKFQIGPGNVFRGCRAWENADDGFDLWRAPHPVRIENCVAYRNGLDLWGITGFSGNGNGFKLGGNFVPAAHVVVNCVAMDQPKNGFDQNNNTAALTVEHCTALRCETGFSFTLVPSSEQPHVLRGNVGWNAPAVLVEGTVQESNHWTSEFRAQLAPTLVPSTAITRKPVAGAPESSVGLQLWSLNDQIKADQRAGLDVARGFGLSKVETAGTGGLTPERFRDLLKERGLQPVAGHFGYDRLKQDLPAVINEARILGHEFVICPVLPRTLTWDEATARAVAKEFNDWGRAVRAAGLRFGFHTHGNEFTPLVDRPDKTVFDVLMTETDPELVCFEMDVFWVVHAGRDPLALLAAYPERWRLMHLKDLRIGAVTGLVTGKAAPTDKVPVGTGQIDWKTLLPAAQKAGVRYFFIEDESTAPLQGIPSSLRYLRPFKL